MMFQSIVAALSLATAASATAISVPRAPDPIMGPATCGVAGVERLLDHNDLAKGVEEFALWVERGADGQIDAAGNFHYKLHWDTPHATLFACDYKSGNKGSIITGQLIRKALGNDGWLDQQCKKDNAGYESSNDLVVGRTFAGDGYC